MDKALASFIERMKNEADPVEQIRDVQRPTLRSPIQENAATDSSFDKTLAQLSQPLARAQIPLKLARRYEILPISLQEILSQWPSAESSTFNQRQTQSILVALVGETFSERDRTEIQRLLNCEVLTESIPSPTVQRAITLAYGIDDVPEEVSGTSSDRAPNEPSKTLDAPAAQLLMRILRSAQLFDASDVHIRESAKELQILLRIDGCLIEIPQLRELNLQHELGNIPAFGRYLRILSGCDITRCHLPAEGGFDVRNTDVPMRVRASFLPTSAGCSTVLRLLRAVEADERDRALSFSELGMTTEMTCQLVDLLENERGAILSCGPTGSGKSTLLAACVHHLRQDLQKIITIEDPVEYRFDNVEQVDLSTTPGLSTEHVLPLILRQDPDVIVIGEIRSKQQALLALEGAVTGHLILSTLHAGSTTEALLRLMRFLGEQIELLQAVSGVISQRLLPRNCVQCSAHVRSDSFEAEELERRGIQTSAVQPLIEGRGCAMCRFTGLRGRIGIFELTRLPAESMDRVELTEGLQKFESFKLPRLEAPLDHSKGLTLQMKANSLSTLQNGKQALASCAQYSFREGIQHHLRYGNLSPKVALHFIRSSRACG